LLAALLVEQAGRALLQPQLLLFQDALLR